MTTLTLNFSDKEKYIEDYFKANNIDQETLTFEELFEVLEDASDYAAGMEALAERAKNPNQSTYTPKEVADELGIAL